MLGYCGINCAECPAYKGTVNYDLSLLEKAAAGYGEGKYPVEDWACLGCPPADQSFLAKYCAGCRIRACAIAKKLSSCAGCDDFEQCSLLQDFMEGATVRGLKEKMRLLRKRFLNQ